MDVSTLAAFMALPAVLYSILTLLIPSKINTIFGTCLRLGLDSPYWLMDKGRETEALNALQWLRGKCNDVSAEFEEIRAKSLWSKRLMAEKSLLGAFRDPAFLRPLLMVRLLTIVVGWLMNGLSRLVSSWC